MGGLPHCMGVFVVEGLELSSWCLLRALEHAPCSSLCPLPLPVEWSDGVRPCRGNLDVQGGVQSGLDQTCNIFLLEMSLYALRVLPVPGSETK